MHDHDFELISREQQDDGSEVFHVRIKAANAERFYKYHPEEDSFQITGEQRTIVVAGHDMTSIIGKRVREWLRSSVVK